MVFLRPDGIDYNVLFIEFDIANLRQTKGQYTGF